MSLLKKVLRKVQTFAPIAAAVLPGKPGAIAAAIGKAAEKYEKDRGAK